jgi:hypothetical protein
LTETVHIALIRDLAAGHVADVMPVVIGGLAGAAAVLWLFRAAAPQLAQGPLRHGRGGTRRRTR